MVARIQILRSGTAGNRPTGKQYGEPYVNMAENQFGVMNASNVATDLLGVPIFSPSTTYAIGNAVNYQGKLYIALVAISAAAFNPAQWSLVVAASQVLQPGVTNTITVGYTYTSYNAGTITTGTFTPSAANGNYQYYTNNGPHTIAVPAVESAIDILVTNGASAGAITFTGYTVGSPGDSLTTVNGNKFIISIRRISTTSTYAIKALQ
jgi:hypothetical protein